MHHGHMSRTAVLVAVLAVGAMTGSGCIVGSSTEPGSATGRSASAEPVDRPFEGNQLRINLSAGKYVIRGTPDRRIRVNWSTRDPLDGRKVRVGVEASGSRGRIDVNGPSNGFAVEMTLPSRCDLRLELTAGDLLLTGIEGHKDVHVNAGDVKIGIQKATAYRSVSTFVMAGDISADPFGGSKGGLFRRFSWSGTGSYDLRARLLAGDLTLDYDATLAADLQ